MGKKLEGWQLRKLESQGGARSAVEGNSGSDYFFIVLDLWGRRQL